MGFFCFAGPIKIFVSSYLLPEEFEYQSTEEASFVSSDGEARVRAGCDVRVRIVGVRLEAHECVGPRWLLCRQSLCVVCYRAVFMSGHRLARLVSMVAWQQMCCLKSVPVCVCVSSSCACGHLQTCIASMKDDYMGVVSM